MRSKRLISVLDYHTEGHPARIIIGGVGPIPGKTMMERSEHFEEHFDDLRQFILFQPRGLNYMVAMLLTPPIETDANMGMLILEIPGMASMCGHGTIAAVTAMLEIGLIPTQEPLTRVVLDTPAGRVTAEAYVQDGRVGQVTVYNVPSYPICLGETVNVPDIGGVSVDVAYGGDYYAIINSNDVGLEIKLGERTNIVGVADQVRNAIAEQLHLRDPLNQRSIQITSIQFWTDATRTDATFKNIVSFPPSQIDRSPCGTGTCARMATLYARGQLQIGQPFVHESIIGTVFHAMLVEEIIIGNLKAVRPKFTGKAFITGIHQLYLDPTDPLPKGYLLAER